MRRFAEVLDALVARMNWDKPFDRGTGTLRRGRGIAIAMKALISPTTSVAIVNISADGSVTAYVGTVDMGQGSDTAYAQIVGEVLGDRGRNRSYRALRYRCDALRHGHARLPLALSHGQCRAACRRRGAHEIARAGKRSRPARRHQLSAGGDIQEAIRHAGRQCHRHRELRAELQVARSADRPVGQRHPVLDGRRRRRRSRGRHRNRTRAHSPAG